MIEIKLGPDIGIEDVGLWRCHKDADVAFLVFRHSRLGHLSEGLALAKLRFLSNTSSGIHVRLAFEIGHLDPKNPILEGVFASLFGMELVLKATSVTDSDGKEVRANLWRVCWQAVVLGNGLFGDGKRQYLVSRDPIYDCPTIFRKESIHDFPFPGEFRRVLRNVARGLLGLEEFLSSTLDEPVITFIYETALNSFEHGRIDEGENVINGIRGSFIEKLQFTKSEILDRRQGLSKVVKEYLSTTWNDLEGSRYQFISLTVTDTGRGIHNTLTSEPGESAWQRLNRAFGEGISRKSPAADTRRGLGLSKVLESCHQLKAFLFVASADQIGYRSFAGENNDANRGSEILSHWPDLRDYQNVGTTLSILFPLTRGRVVQPNLFPESLESK